MSKYDDWKYEEATLQLSETDGPNSPEWDRLHDSLMENEEFDQKCRDNLVAHNECLFKRVAELQALLGIGQEVQLNIVASEITVGSPTSARQALVRAYNTLHPARDAQLRADLFATLETLR